ncbi:MAG TPA: molybdenum cofactor biosynthesis protein MoaE [Actinomycetota bacterium]|nr:molybdenum cofactor biosynthesis protein MoaE [Actinomycetota bacterium]
MKAQVIVCSDSASAGRSEDTTGPVLAAGLRDLGCEVADVLLVPDDVAAITAVIRAHAADLVLCTGGTGLGPRDVTPDAVLSVIDRELPGFGEAFRARGRAQTPLADLSRAVAGSMGATLVVAIPGSHGAVADGLAVLGPLLEHAHHVVQGADHRGLVRATPITVAEVEAAVTRPDAGAVVVFAGRVRDHDHGRSVAALTYEAHPDADKVMADVLADASAQPGVLAAASLHRTGDLAIGDLAFVAAVSASHRGEAFDACSWLVDEVKHRLPVWKLQRFDDGSQEWVHCA